MRYKAKFVSAGIVLVAATACADPEASGPPPPAAGQQLPVSSPSAPAGSVALPAGQLDATGFPPGSPREVYTDRGGKILSVKAEEGGCGHAVATAVEQGAQRVVIALSETPGRPGQMCTMDIRYPVVSMTLDAPLGERTVVVNKEPRDR